MERIKRMGDGKNGKREMGIGKNGKWEEWEMGRMENGKNGK